MTSATVTPTSEQLNRYRAGEDRNTEHYRYAAFLRLLEREPFGDAFVDRFVRLVVADPDPVMGESAIIQLLRRHPFSDVQFAALRARPELSLLKKRFAREELRRQSK